MNLRLTWLDLLGVCACLCLIVGALVVLAPASPSRARPAAPKGSPWTGQGVWVWYVKDSPSQLAEKIEGAGVKTAFIKSADGTKPWSQLTPGLVDALHARGIHVCGWQYAYGKYPKGEAVAAARVKESGADCFVIDAEEEYKGRRQNARIYMRELSKRLGPDVRVGFTSFPYVDLHSSLPYEVFLKGAEANLPQMYWHEIGRSPGRVVRETYKQNLALGRPVYPIGQTYRNPPMYELTVFYRAIKKTGARGWSWWSLDHSRPAQLRRLASFK